ncbi:MAG: zinc-ribbon domain-containing protein [Pseudomonadota bacterium]
MRLTCPNCDAQYEVADEVIPTEGRDVQCSNCGNTWYQYHPDHMPAPDMVEETTPDLIDEPDVPGEDEERIEAAPPPPPPPPLSPEPEPEPKPEPEEAGPEPQRRQLDDGITDILREEAEREQQARAAQAIETQPDLGLDTVESETDRRAREARERMARLRGEEPGPAEAAATAAAVGSRKELLPDIEEINSTLRATGGRDTRQPDIDPDAPTPRKARGTFRGGFLLMIGLAVVLIALYAFAPMLAQAVPQVDPYLSGYVATVDGARSWLNDRLAGVLVWLDAMASES